MNYNWFNLQPILLEEKWPFPRSGVDISAIDFSNVAHTTAFQRSIIE